MIILCLQPPQFRSGSRGQGPFGAVVISSGEGGICFLAVGLCQGDADGEQSVKVVSDPGLGVVTLYYTPPLGAMNGTSARAVLRKPLVCQWKHSKGVIQGIYLF